MSAEKFGPEPLAEDLVDRVPGAGDRHLS